jgi:hypothetical protein
VPTLTITVGEISIPNHKKRGKKTRTKFHFFARRENRAAADCLPANVWSMFFQFLVLLSLEKIREKKRAKVARLVNFGHRRFFCAFFALENAFRVETQAWEQPESSRNHE